MITIQARNVHQALKMGMQILDEQGVERDSRVGKVKVMDGPITTVYQAPTERVVFWPDRDANPFFHFMEGLWMLAGRNDVAWIEQFAASMKNFSDDGITFHGPYGYRWINHFAKQIDPDPDVQEHGGGFYVPFNQLETIVQMLRENPNERRCVLQMWDAEVDLGRKGKDVPCNTNIFLKLNLEGNLDMTVCCRSNDIIWGAYGANAVHMSMMQEFVASWLGVKVGRYWQISNDWHGYVDVFEKHRGVLDTKESSFDHPYVGGRKGFNRVAPFPMVNGPIEEWLGDLQMFMDEGPVPGFRDRFFKKVVVPMWDAWWAWKDKDNPRRIDEALEHVNRIAASDWRLACTEWLERRR